eukprot:4491265-Pyramimonas_sp.AAC.1
MARLQAQSVGFDLPNFQLLTTILFRALGVGNQRAMQLYSHSTTERPEHNNSMMSCWRGCVR